MKSGVAAVTLLAFVALANASEVSPIEKVIEMISDLQAKVLKEGEEAQKIYTEFAEFCEDKSRDLGFEIKTGKAEVAELKATIEKETANIGALESKIEELSSDIGTSEKELAEATKVREREAADFAVEEKELTETLSMLERATSILSREMEKAAKGGAAMLQLKSATSLTQALSVMVQASVFSSADASRLTALVQTSHQSEDDDEEPGAPAAAVYEGQSGGIIATLEGLTEKAQTQLDEARKEESESAHNYDMLKQSLTDAINFATKDMDKAKKGLAESEESKATAEGDLEATQKDLDEDIKAKQQLHTECMEGATEFELSTKSRGEELAALAEAKKVVVEATGGAAEQTYSFLQVASDASMTHVEAERFIRNLAKKTKAPALAQLASRISSVVRLSSASGDDPFAKVEGLIKEMIATLEAEAEADATQKAYCDKEMGENNAKKDDLSAEVESLSTKIAQDSAHSKKLKEEVATLQAELASMAKARAEADKLRVEEEETYKKNSAEMAMGIEGVKKALSVLKEYYSKDDKAHDANEGAASGIIGLLEVCESDFTKGLTEMTAAEESAAKEYKDYCDEDDISKAKKEKAVEFKTQEAAALDKKVSELQNDLEGVSDELAAVNKVLKKLEEMCIAKPETYEERKKRRDAEIAGLKEALQILDGEAVLLQKTSKHTLRGARPHRA